MRAASHVEAIEHAVLERFVIDRAEGRERTLEEYQSLWPTHRDVVAACFANLVADPEESAAESAVRTIGPYEVIRPVGRGGQGTVYLARDTRLPREVALKVLPRSTMLLSPERLTRFRREAEIASRLDHPGLCPVHEIGEDGEVFFIAMRFVPGETLAARLERGALVGESGKGLGEVLALFIEIAEALHAAHEAGVVHRDVKPGNVMITPDGSPVVLDFGLAVDDANPAETLTRTGDVFGTPAYMSPEQVRGSSSHSDRRTDVYSLGAVLYECLTGRRPFVGEQAADLFGEILEGRFEPIGSRSMPGELGTVVAVAMERDPARRYQDLAAFAEDLRRVRERRSILARPIPRHVRAKRWFERNRVFALGAAATVAALTVGLVLTSQQAGRAQRAEQEALAEARRAQDVRDILLRDLFTSADPWRDGPDVRVREVLERAETRLAEAERDPLVEAEVAGLLGRIWTKLGKNKRAVPLLERAVSMHTELLGPDHPLTLEEKLAWSHASMEVGEVEQGLSLSAVVLERRRETLGDHDPSTLEALVLHSQQRIVVGDVAPAVEELEEAVAGLVEVVGPDAEETLTAQTYLAQALFQSGELERGFAMMEETLERWRALVDEYHPNLIVSTSYFASMLRALGRYGEAIELLEWAADGASRSLGPTQLDAVEVRMQLAMAYLDTELLDDALPLAQECFDAALESRGIGSEQTLEVGNTLAITLHESGSRAEAEELFQRLVNQHREQPKTSPELFARTLNSFAVLLTEEDRLDEAAELYLEALAIQRELYGDVHPDLATTLGNLSVNLRLQGRYAESLPYSREVLEQDVAFLGEEHPYITGDMQSLGNALLHVGELEEAEDVLRRAIELENRLRPGNLKLVRNCEVLLGHVLVEQGRVTEAEPLILDGLYWLEQGNAVPDNSAMERARAAAVALFEAMGLPDEAARYRE